MDEYLFISMAKLGADRVRKERLYRTAAPASYRDRVVRSRPAVRPVKPSPAATRLATYSLAFALGLATLGVGGGIAAVLEQVPEGQVIVTELDAGGVVPDEVKVALNQTASPRAR